MTLDLSVIQGGRSVSRKDFYFASAASKCSCLGPSLVLFSQRLVLWGYLLLSLLEMGTSQVIFFSFSELATALPVSNYSGGSSL